MRSSSLGEGRTTIDLLVSTPRPFQLVPLKTDQDVWFRPQEARESGAELAGVSPEAAALLGNPGTAALARQQISAPLARFKKDFLGRLKP